MEATITRLREKGYHSFSVDGKKIITLSAFAKNAKQATIVSLSLDEHTIEVLLKKFTFISDDREQ